MRIKERRRQSWWEQGREDGTKAYVDSWDMARRIGEVMEQILCHYLTHDGPWSQLWRSSGLPATLLLPARNRPCRSCPMSCPCSCQCSCRDTHCLCSTW